MRRLIPAAAAAVFFAVMVALYALGHRHVYEETLRTWGVDPFRFPFVDVETVLSAVRCMNAGVDILATNPCDPVRRVFDYSPLWLLLARLPVTEAWTMPAGFLVVVMFIASLAWLPAGRTRGATLIITLGAISSAVVFAVERGNNDLVLFVLAVIAAVLACKTPALRLLGYAAALLAGLLKYYPMTLMTLATRERPARFLAVAAASVVVIGVLIATMGHELSRALKLIPGGGWFGDMFGYAMLAGGLNREFGISSGATSFLRIGLPILAFVLGIVMATRPIVGRAVAPLSEPERTTLLAGGLLIISCFFTAQNIGYRATHLLLTLPALTAIGRAGTARVWSVTTVTVLALLWTQGWRNWIFSQDEGRRVFIAGWMVREVLWWWTITMLIALVSGLLMRSEMGRRVLGRAAPKL